MVGLDPPLCKLKELVLPLLMKDEEVLGVEQPLIKKEMVNQPMDGNVSSPNEVHSVNRSIAQKYMSLAL